MRYNGWLFTVLMVAPAVSSADVITYDFGLNTSTLIGHAAGPFSLEFQLNDGSGTGNGNNTALLNSFTFGGGSAVGLPTLTGGATGDAGGSVTLTDSSFFNQFIQPFTPSNQLGFRLTLSTNVEAGGVPDQFTFAILDSSGVELPTLASFFDVFVQIDIDAANPFVQTFGTDTSRMPAAGGVPLDIAAPTATAVAAVPEPMSLLLPASALVTIGFLHRRKSIEH